MIDYLSVQLSTIFYRAGLVFNARVMWGLLLGHRGYAGMHRGWDGAVSVMWVCKGGRGVFVGGRFRIYLQNSSLHLAVSLSSHITEE